MPGLDGAIEDVTLDDDGDVHARRDRRRRRRGHLRLRARRPDERAAPHRPDERDGPLRGRRRTRHARRRRATSIFLESDVNELAQAKGANVAGLQVVFSNYGISFDDIDVFYLAGGFGRHLKKDASQADRADPEPSGRAGSCRSATRRSRARASRCCRGRSATSSKRW